MRPLPQMPTAVFVHAESASVLQADQQRVDLAALASVLRASRFTVGVGHLAREDHDVLVGHVVGPSIAQSHQEVGRDRRRNVCRV